MQTTNGICLECRVCKACLEPGMGMPSLERQPSMSRTNARRLGAMERRGGQGRGRRKEGGRGKADFPPLHPSNFFPMIA